MQEKGIMSEIKDLSRFNYVLITRSSPTHLDQERFINDMVERMSSDKKSQDTALKKSRASTKAELLVTPAPLSKNQANSNTIEDYSSTEKTRMDLTNT